MVELNEDFVFTLVQEPAPPGALDTNLQGFATELLEDGSVAINGLGLVDGAGATQTLESQTITIENDDAATININMTTTDDDGDGDTSTQTEGANGDGLSYTYEITSTADVQTSTLPASFTIATTTVDGTAGDDTAVDFTGDGDYQASGLTITGWDGDSSSAIDSSGAVSINGDDIVEANELFNVQITSAIVKFD